MVLPVVDDLHHAELVVVFVIKSVTTVRTSSRWRVEDTDSGVPNSSNWTGSLSLVAVFGFLHAAKTISFEDDART